MFHLNSFILGQASKKRVSNAAVVPKTTPAEPPAIAKAPKGASAVQIQPTPDLPQSASVSARKNPIAVKPTATAAADRTLTPELIANEDSTKSESSDASARPATQNPLTAIMNDKSMILTRQYRQRIRIKYSGERSTRVNLLNERNTTKENIPKSASKVAAMKNDKHDDMAVDSKLTENMSNNMKGETSGSVNAKASAAAAAQKVKKRARKIASATNVKMQRTYKIDGKSGDKLFPCRHCGRKYRWKSTLRRHENDECGGKAPAHSCPYCKLIVHFIFFFYYYLSTQLIFAFCIWLPKFGSK